MIVVATAMSCPYCSATFKTEKGASRHRCQKRQFAEEAGSASLMRAFVLFDFWFRYNGFGKKAKTMAEFRKSPYFKTFVRLDERATKIYLGSAMEYLRWLSDKRIPSDAWFADETAAKYRSDVARSEDAGTAVVRSLENMASFCDRRGADISDFFSVVKAGELSTMIDTGRVSPWVLVSTRKLDQLIDRADDADSLERLALAFDSDYWAMRVQLSPERAREAAEILREVSL
jgi:hypothetical protein